MLMRRDLLNAQYGRDVQLLQAIFANPAFAATVSMRAVEGSMLVNDEKTSGLLQVRYRYDDAAGELWRGVREVGAQWVEMLLFEEFMLDDLNFFDGYGWSNSWGIYDSAIARPQAVEEFPHAINRYPIDCHNKTDA